ncbi:MAG TPA: hypothetical protein VLI67_04715 [Vicinamibacteria bacterium]|nr:hypothetical protein [Vicinamibacteria bacterium]
MPTMFDPARHAEIRSRLMALKPDAARRWGRMSAAQMVAHLSDQMRHSLGDRPCAPVRGPLRWRLARYLSIYWVPWPKGRVSGPPEAFLSKPSGWEADVKALEGLLERFVRKGPGGDWPEHALFGTMTGRDWGAFCYKHFNHHLSQFGM